MNLSHEQNYIGMKPLKDFLESISLGQLNEQQTAHLLPLLLRYWSQFSGGESTKMKGYKLDRGIENVFWNPPMLSFIIERHGMTVLGSTKAELQRWKINIETKIAEFEPFSGMRLVHPRQKRIDVNFIAVEILQLILNDRPDDRIKWYEDGKIKIQIGKIEELTEGSAVRQTLQGRRKRFRTAMDQFMIENGWQKIKPNLYQPDSFKN